MSRLRIVIYHDATVLYAWGRRVNQAIKQSALIYAFSEEDRKVFERKGAGRVSIMLGAGRTVEDHKTVSVSFSAKYLAVICNPIPLCSRNGNRLPSL